MSTEHSDSGAERATPVVAQDRWQLAYAVAAETGRDPRSVIAVLNGRHVRGRAGEAIKAALRRRGVGGP